MFRWTPLLPEADSITLCLDRELIKSTHPDSLRPLVEKMEMIAENYPDIKQLRARAYFWRAKMYHKLEMSDSMDYWSEQSRILMDSARYPYDQARLNLLVSTEVSDGTIDSYMRVMKAIDYAQKTTDPYLEANALSTSDLLKKVLEIKSDDGELNRISELFSDLGLVQ